MDRVALGHGSRVGRHGHDPLRFYTYGAHNLSNQFGVHRVFNRQYGGAWASLCGGYNGGGGLQGVLGAGYSYDFNLTPVNSIVLSRAVDFDCFG
jgi:hypothetical protein